MKMGMFLLGALMLASATAQVSDDFLSGLPSDYPLTQGVSTGNFIDGFSLDAHCEVLPTRYVTDCDCLVLMTDQFSLSGGYQLTTSEFCAIPKCLQQYKNFHAALGQSTNSNCSSIRLSFGIGGASQEDCSRCDLRSVGESFFEFIVAVQNYTQSQDCSALDGFSCCHGLILASSLTGNEEADAQVMETLESLATCGIDVATCDLCPQHGPESGEICDNFLVTEELQVVAPSSSSTCSGADEYSMDLLFNQLGCTVNPRDHLVSASCVELVNTALQSSTGTSNICSNSTCAGEVQSLSNALRDRYDISKGEDFGCGHLLSVMSGLGTFTPSTSTNCSQNCASAFLELQTLFPQGPPSSFSAEQCSRLSCCHTAALKETTSLSFGLPDEIKNGILALIENDCDIPADCDYFHCDGTSGDVCPLNFEPTEAPSVTTTPAPTSGAFSASVSLLFVILSVLLGSMMV